MKRDAHSLIQDLYSINYSKAATELTLDKLCHYLDASQAVVGYFDQIEGHSWEIGSEVFRKLVDTEKWRVHKRNFSTFYGLTVAKAIERGSETMVAPDDLVLSRDQGELRKAWLRDTQRILGYSNFLGGAFATKTSASGFLGLGFSNELKPRMGEIIAKNEFWLRHFTGASVLHQRIRRTRAIEVALSRMKWGVLILDRQERVIYANSAAEALIYDHPDLSLTAGRFIASGNVLAGLKESSLSGTPDAKRNHIEVLSAGCEKVECVVFCTAYSDADEALSDQTSGTLVFLLDTSTGLSEAILVASELFGLSPAESGVLQLLVQGHSRSEIAERRGVAPETVKTQISQILQKTACAKRSQVISRVSMFDPPFII